MNIVDAIGYGDDRHAAAFERDRPLRYTHTHTHTHTNAYIIHSSYALHMQILQPPHHTPIREREGYGISAAFALDRTMPLTLHTDLAVPVPVHVALNLTQGPLSFSRGYSIYVSLSLFLSLSLSLSPSQSQSLSLALAAVVVMVVQKLDSQSAKARLQ